MFVELMVRNSFRATRWKRQSCIYLAYMEWRCMMLIKLEWRLSIKNKITQSECLYIRVLIV